MTIVVNRFILIYGIFPDFEIKESILEGETVLRSMFRCLMILMISFCLLSSANATTIVLQTGERIIGQLIERTELRVTLDVQGLPETFYLGEIASIDGQAVALPQERKLTADLNREEKNPAPYYGDEQDSLAKFMKKRNPNTPAQNQPAPQPAPVKPVAISSLPLTQPQAAPPPGPGMNKTVISTPDGGLIIVDNDKITKFDKNLQLVRKVDLTAAASQADNPPATALPPAAPAASTPAASPATPASPAQIQSPAAQDLPTLKDALSSFFSDPKKS